MSELYDKLGTIDSPEYLKARILFFKEEKRQAIERANHMIKFYTKLLKECDKSA